MPAFAGMTYCSYLYNSEALLYRIARYEYFIVFKLGLIPKGLHVYSSVKYAFVRPRPGSYVFLSNNCYKHLNPPDSFYKPRLALESFPISLFGFKSNYLRIKKGLYDNNFIQTFDYLPSFCGQINFIQTYFSRIIFFVWLKEPAFS